MPDKFCKDCKHAKESPDGNPYRMTCDSPMNAVPTQNKARYLVSGIEQPVILAMRGASCTALRQDRGQEVNEVICGPAGLWFEAKE